jgi:hypothetical protein
MVPTDGAVHGEPCSSPDDCLSVNCRRDTNAAGAPTGWANGMCVRNCILPAGYNTSNLWPEPSLPQGDCPAGGICFPEGSFTRGDRGLCYRGCVDPADCRPGYTCRAGFMLTGGPVTFDNGICVPIDCSREMCPAGYTCRTVMFSDGSTGNLCGR